EFTPGPRPQVAPSVLAIESERPCVRRAHAEARGAHAVSLEKTHRIVLQFGSDAGAAHVVGEVEEARIADARLFADLKLHLSDDPVAIPQMNIAVRKFHGSLPELLEIVRAVRTGLVVEPVVAEAADERVATERDANGGVGIEVDRLEREAI